MPLDSLQKGNRIPPLSREHANSRDATPRGAFLVRALLVLLFSVLFVGAAEQHVERAIQLAFQTNTSSESDFPCIAQESETESAECSADELWEDDIEEYGSYAVSTAWEPPFRPSKSHLVTPPPRIPLAARLRFSLQSRAPPAA